MSRFVRRGGWDIPLVRSKKGKQNTMIRGLRKKFVMTAMGSLLIILVLLIGTINIGYLIQLDRGAGAMLEMLLDNGGMFPPFDTPEPIGVTDAMDAPNPIENDENPPDPPIDWRSAYQAEAPFETRFFSVLVTDGEAQSIDVDHIAAITEELAQRYALRAAEDSRDQGYYSSYKFGKKVNDDGSILVVIVDCSSRFSSLMWLARISLAIGVAALVLMFITVYLLSGLAVRPAAESMEKQKRFISDAGHELKTPLAVISANVDVLEMDGASNEWTKSIRNQVRRMTELVGNMLALSRMEEGNADALFADVDLSQVMRESVVTYRSVAQTKGRRFDTDIASGIHMQGDRRSLAQLSSILLDNAMKYSSEGSIVSVRLSKDDKGILYTVSNRCDEMPEGDLGRLFDRFYRADSSRARESGGYGIGLSVAKAICENHGGTITATAEEGNIIRFAARLPVV